MQREVPSEPHDRNRKPEEGGSASPGHEEFKTTWGEAIATVYPRRDVTGDAEIGLPGSYPFTRGVHATMYRTKLWTMRQYAGFATSEESNKRYKYLLSQGQGALSVAFDLPTQLGYDSDDPHSLGEVGRVGVAIDSLADMETLFDGIALKDISTSMTINATAPIILAMYLVVGERQGANRALLQGTVQNDILKEYIARGTYIYPPKPSMRLITNLFEFCSQHMPMWNPISVSGYHIREAGSDAVQEVAFMLADGIEYVQAAIKAGLDPGVFGKRLSFFLASGNEFFEEIAKCRAARRGWAKIMKDRFHVADLDAMKLRVHVQTSGSTLTAQQPQNNIVRVTLQALAGVLGGAQSLHTNAYDEALALPTEESATIALRTQQIIAYESGVTKTVDPLAGSYYIEALTDSIERQTCRYLQQIEEMGGMVAAIESGYVQQEILRSAYESHRAVESGRQVVVGVNKFTAEPDSPNALFKVDEEIERRQIHNLRAVKARRSGDRVAKALECLEKAAQGDGNLMFPIIDAVETYATVGEISNVLRRAFGEYEGSATV